ncbi:Uncharacterized protein FKW44_013135 [Caligus rogercresseyi]|uniref:Uncharacterized protein n=1 Tax=Caligus rogercresseyi TaxID=217165 RepID=A0A7T8KA31_CALRO|nr:Uncharacterized protein FKW44_013135 [Caligus rogercresseyi]
MEQTRRDTVIELLCAGHRPAAITKLLKYPRRTVYGITKKWEESEMSKRKSTSLGVTESARPHLWQVSRGPSRPIQGRPCPSSPGAWGPPVVVPWMDSVTSGTPYTSAPAHTAKLVQSWLKKNVPNFWDFNTWPPNSPGLNSCDYYM